MEFIKKNQMKNTFLITEEEKSRILGMHQYATKNQYIGNINEETNQKIDKGFDKYPCVKDMLNAPGWLGYDLNKDGVIEIISPHLTDKQYFADGTVKFFSGTDKVTSAKYSCSGSKIIDNFIKNPKGKVYTNNDPFIKDSTGEMIIPWFTKDPEGSKWIAKLQQKLIDKHLLNISKPTGYFGNMTQNALKTALSSYGGRENVRGITKDFYNRFVNLEKGQ